MALSLRYDPYSPTAVDDYESLRAQIERFDVLGMLAGELSKTRVHAALTRRLVQAIRYLDEAARDAAARTLVDHMDTLSPVLPNVLCALTDMFDDLGTDTRAHIAGVVRDSMTAKRYYATVPVNLGYAVRLLGHDRTEQTQILLAQVFDDAPHFVQRDIVLIMGRWRAQYSLSDKRMQFAHLHAWPQRALIIASFVLEDEGKYWRRQIAAQLSGFDTLVKAWVDDRSKVSGWQVPL